MKTTNTNKLELGNGAGETVETNVQPPPRPGFKATGRDLCRINIGQELAAGYIKISRGALQTKKAAAAHTSELLLASRLSDLLENCDPERIKELMKGKPEQFFRLATAVGGQFDESLSLQKLDFEVQKHNDKKQKRQKESQPGGLTPDILAEIENAAKIL